MPCETARPQSRVETRTCSPRVRVLGPVEHRSGEASRRLGIVLAAQKAHLFPFTAHWGPRNVPSPLRPHAPGCPIRSRSGTSCSELELTGWPENAAKSQPMRTCEARGREKVRLKGRTVDGQADTGAAPKGGATWRCHGNRERGGGEQRSSWAEFRP